MKKIHYFIFLFVPFFISSCAGGWRSLTPVDEGQVVDMGNYEITIPKGEGWSVKTNMSQGYLFLLKKGPEKKVTTISIAPGKLESKFVSDHSNEYFKADIILGAELDDLKEKGKNKKYEVKNWNKEIVLIEGRRLNAIYYEVLDYSKSEEIHTNEAMFVYFPFDYKTRKIFYSFIIGVSVKVGNFFFNGDLSVINSVISSFREKDVNPLIAAVNFQDINTVKSIIKAGTDVNILLNDGSGDTPLSLAIRKSLNFNAIIMQNECDSYHMKYEQRKECRTVPDTTIIEALIKAGADINQVDRKGNTIVERSINYQGDEIPTLLLESGANVNQGEPLMLAAYYGQTNLARLFIKYGVDINKKSEKKDNNYNKYTNGMTALHFASIKGHDETVKALLEEGINPDIRNINGDTALIIAAMQGYFRVVRELITYGANLNIRNKDNYTALKIAKKNGRADTISILEDAGAQE